MPGDTPLAEFLARPATQEALASRQYRVFVLQGQDGEPVDHKRDFQQAVRAFHRAIKAAGAKTVLFMTWDFPDRHFLKPLADSYDEIGRELDVPVIPVGLIYQDCAQTHPFQHGRYWLTARPAEPAGGQHENVDGIGREHLRHLRHADRGESSRDELRRARKHQQRRAHAIALRHGLGLGDPSWAARLTSPVELR